MISSKRLLFLPLVLGTGVVAQEGTAVCPPGFHTLYSSHATTLDSAVERAVVLTSPDRKKSLSARTVEDSKDADGLDIVYTVTMGRSTFRAKLPGFNGEIAWSPDSKAFAVTQTEGGGGIGSRVYVFYVDENGMTRLDVSRPVEKDFGHPVKCEVKVPPNTGFIRWGADSSTLLVAAEVVPVSICRCMGTYRVYEIAMPSLTIVHTYSQTEAKRRLRGDLGCELRGADDKCVQAVESYARQRQGH